MSRLAGTLVLLALWLSGLVPAAAGHEFPFYPSFYPQEIRIEVVDPPAAATRLRDGSLHAYVGDDPFGTRDVPGAVAHVESLGAYVMVTLNPAAAFFADRSRRCLAARAVSRSLATGGGDYRPYPYPVTPYHADFLQHVDLVEAVKQEYRIRAAESAAGAPLRIRARGARAEALVPSILRADDTAWDASVETVDVADLRVVPAVGLIGWVGLPWIKEGWFHAYLLEGGAVADEGARHTAAAIVDQLVTGAYDGLVERLNLERRLVSLLREGCERIVAGYTVRREYFNAEYSGGVENVGHDAQAGLNSAIFPRTVKLKDFPWNGWLTVGIRGRATAAWNPVAGFGDVGGRLIWAAVGDPALLPAPHGGPWVPNRVTATVSLGSVEVPGDALVPEPGTGLLRKVPAGRRAGARVVYRVLASRFHDGTRTTVADVLYALSFAYRWGHGSAAPAGSADPTVVAATALLRERLVGVRALRVETDVLAFGEDKLTYEVPVVEVYLDHRAADPLEAAAIAPPWSSVPWHLLVLMEEAVARGLAAFSREEAQRRGVRWLDLARDQKLRDALAPMIEDFARRGHVPAALVGTVTAEEARQRWAAVKTFYDTYRHLVVTNGPYRLHEWSDTFTVLRVFRDLTYPRGVGSFDRYAIPLRAYVSKAEVGGDELTIQAEVEKVERFGREYRIVREPFSKQVSEQDGRRLPVCHYVVVGPDGAIEKAGTSEATGPGTFRVALAGLAKTGGYTILVALSLDDNRVNLPVTAVPWTR